MNCPACYEKIEGDIPGSAIVLYCYRSNRQTAPSEVWGNVHTRVNYGTKGERVWNDERAAQTGIEAPASHILQLEP